MLKIGLTGGIGSGKSTVASIFRALDIPVYKSDERAKWLMSNDNSVKKNLVQTFGNEVYIKDKLNVSYLSSLVFKNQKHLDELNKIVHPAVADDFIKWYKGQKASYIIKEAAILIESGAYKQMDQIILVTAELDVRLERIIKRDKLSEKSVLQRVKNQMSDEDKMHHAHYIIKNNSSVESLNNQVKTIHHKLLEN